MITPGQVEIRGETATIHAHDGTHEVDISNPENPVYVGRVVDGPSLFYCPVPGCDHMTGSVNALGPHLAMHRRRGDQGVPPPSGKSKSKKAKPIIAAAAPSTKPAPKPKPKLAPSDVANGVLAVLYPKSIPTDRLRDVAAWVEATDRLADQALADQVEP